MARFEISNDYLQRFLVDLLNTPSPTGDTDYAISFVEGELMSLDIPTERTRTGALIAKVDGLQRTKPRLITAHVDTLGAMVREIKSSGRLAMTALNGVQWPAVESEGVTISTRSGRNVRGSIVFHNGSSHVNRSVHTDARTADSLEIRLDERTNSAEETRFLGIEVGDFVAFDPRVEVSESGFVRSRFLDDKACVATVLAALEAIKKYDLTPSQDTYILINNVEEVGRLSLDGIPSELAEMLVLDMGCVGTGQNGSEFNCSICIKDSAGPYNKDFTEKLRDLAEKRGIELKPDVYPHYASDGSAYMRAGGAARVALIGPGVDNSHAYERTHMNALVDTAQLIAEYLVEE